MSKIINKTKGKIKKENRGITLIALVVTIIILLILAGISISMLTGENGIITKAKIAKDNTRAGDVQEQINLTISSNKMIEISKNGIKETKNQVIERLKNEGKLTEEEVEQLQETDEIIIGTMTVDFSGLDLTIGSVYDDSMIGKKINYTSNGQSDWIIFGKDEEGNVLLTTEGVIENGFTLEASAAKWLTYKDDLNEACSNYGSTIQGKTIESRSITLKDINRVTGFQEPSFKTYTFKDQANNDYASQIVNYYHPDENEENKWSKSEKQYPCNAYYYFYDTDDNNKLKWSYEGTSWNEQECSQTLRNMNYVTKDREDNDLVYVVASHSVNVYSSGANFYVTAVYGGGVSSYGESLCDSYADVFYDYGGSASVPVRPVVSLPSNIQVEEDSAVECNYKIK